MSSLLILGAGGHGQVVADIALEGKWKSIAFLDDKIDLPPPLGLPIVGKLDDYNQHNKVYSHYFVAIGNNKLRLDWLRRLEIEEYPIATIVHPFSHISNFSSIGHGSVIMAGSIVNTNTKIGKGCILNTSSSIDHDSVISDGVHISPGARINGTVEVGSYSWICSNSTISNNVKIGKHAVCAAGATVLKDVPDYVMVAGTPAKIIRHLGGEIT